jgi:transposase-like protein
MARKKTPKAKILRLLRQAQESDKTVAQFCKDHSITQSSYYNWKKRYSSELGSALTSEPTQLSSPLKKPSKDLDITEVKARLKTLEKEAQSLKIQLAERILSSEDI